MESTNAFEAGQGPRRIEPTWNAGLIIASIAVSLLGAFTSTQLMCQARVSRALLAIIVWTMLASLTFGFCSIWSLHFVAMLACELDLSIGLNVGLTILSAFLAVVFTFMALSTDLIQERYRRQKLKKNRPGRKDGHHESSSGLEPYTPRTRESTELLFETRDEDIDSPPPRPAMKTRPTQIRRLTNGHPPEFGPSPVSPYTDNPAIRLEPDSEFALPSPVQQPQDFERFGRISIDSDREDTDSCLNSNASDSRRSSGQSNTESDAAFSGLGKFISIRSYRASQFTSENPFKTTALMLWHGLTVRNIAKGFLWSLAITLMHYLGIISMKFDGFFQLQPVLVFLSALISWVVCTVGCILMSSMETNLGQQLLFSLVASCGVAAMHYTGMAATSFYSTLPPSDVRGYPTSLPIAIASIAIATCLAANGLLAQSATIARNKLAEIVRTRKKLWAAIAQKENAEAAALARSEFIASASHEIRTPLHQLQGYSDLMARCPLPEDARLLLFAIQDATKTLSLITNNVLDWSRLEKGEAVTRPTSLKVRSVCDSIVTLLPRRDDDMDVELIVVVAPAVPKYLYIDETYLQRISMNLVSNALKFTTSGYIFLLLDLVEGSLVITVQDTGVGIPESFLPHLFEPFKQAQTRGAERGTGLGLSIVKQLIQKLQGEIEVESKHRDASGVGPSRCGSKFVVRIPISISETTDDNPEGYPVPGITRRLALFDVPQRRNSEGIIQRRTTEGLAQAWAKFGVEVVMLKDITDLTDDFEYVWVDLKCMKNNTELREELSKRADLTILIPFDTENALYSTLGLSHPAHFVPLKRPYVFHHILQAIDNAGRRPDRSELAGRTVRFASEVDVLSTGGSIYGSEAPSEPVSANSSQPTSPELVLSNQFENKPMNILLVEDNKINQKLGAKMLKTLGYDVVLANDGQEAIDIIVQPESDTGIDMILMDQSMPRKDGLTATKEIRDMEANGTLVGATRWKDCSRRKNRRPIIAVTAVVGPAHEAMCKTVGTDAFLPKPLSLKKLRETLEEFSGEN